MTTHDSFRSQSYTCYDSSAVVTCAICDLIWSSFFIKAKNFFFLKFELWAPKEYAKWIPDLGNLREANKARLVTTQIRIGQQVGWCPHIHPLGAVTGIFWDNQVNTMAADDLIPFISKSPATLALKISATLALNISDKQVSVIQ